MHHFSLDFLTSTTLKNQHLASKIQFSCRRFFPTFSAASLFGRLLLTALSHCFCIRVDCHLVHTILRLIPCMDVAVQSNISMFSLMHALNRALNYQFWHPCSYLYVLSGVISQKGTSPSQSHIWDWSKDLFLHVILLFLSLILKLNNLQSLNCDLIKFTYRNSQVLNLN